ncbi:MAG TPA: sugar phosphate isomerase/epimerase [Mariniphaga sp.]|nr:sugar phosphate isomerase/epimerase [Mariniphaga sp.]
MEYPKSSGKGKRVSRRRFISSAASISAVLSLTPTAFAGTFDMTSKPDSYFNGVQIGAITYSWRSMPSNAQDILKYCVEAGISSIELMGNVAEEYAGIPASPPRISGNASAAAKAIHKTQSEEAREKQRLWRLSNSMKKYHELRNMFKKEGIRFHIVKFAPSNWSDEEIDYAFTAAKVLGADGITNEIGHEACKRLGKFAEKHNMYAIYHNHAQPGDPGFSFDEFLSYSPKNMLNFDVGHYFGATGKHPNEVLERLHSRIYSIHLKDKTGKFASPANTNRQWGKGDTPIADILKLIQENKWPVYCDIELEYQIPDGSDAQKEIIKCVEYCKKILV